MKESQNGNVSELPFTARTVAAIFPRIAFPRIGKMLRVNPLVLYYHIVSDRKPPHVGHLYQFRNVTQFTRDLDVLSKWFRPLTLQDFLSCLEASELPPARSFMLTLDDGLKECYEVVAPILKRKGIPATFFLCSGFIDNKELAYDHKKSLLCEVLKTGKVAPAQKDGVMKALREVEISYTDVFAALLSVTYRQKHILDKIAAILGCDFADYLRTAEPYLTSDQIAGLATMGHAIGAHSIDHPRYADLPLADQLYQTRESIRFVRERFSLDYSAFAFPSSDAQVSRAFFQQTLKENSDILCFGNHGLLEDSVPRNVQRSSMEKTSLPAEAILAKSYARRLWKALSGRLVVQRT